eukprot:g42659.t1
MNICSETVPYGLFPGGHTKPNINRAWRTVNFVKCTVWSAQNLWIFQNKELTLTKCCKLANSKVQDYVLMDTLKLGAAAAKKWASRQDDMLFYVRRKLTFVGPDSSDGKQ